MTTKDGEAWRGGWRLPSVALAAAIALLAAGRLWADGKMVGPATYRSQPYNGSVEERSQEAIIIFQRGEQPGEAKEDLILRVSVQGEVDQFAWVIPFPSEPQVAKEDAKLFKELYEYVEARLRQRHRSSGAKRDNEKEADDKPLAKGVEILSRKIVGSFDVAIVKQNKPGALNEWLKQEGYQALEDADDVLASYDRKQYVYACVKVANAELRKDAAVDLHPLRFSFATGGRDGIYFPMRMTGLQTEPFDVNLYVFFDKWLNDHLSKFGYEHRGFHLKYRDWDTPQCEANAGKAYSTPDRDPFLAGMIREGSAVTELMRKLHPGERYYLTNVQARGLRPESVRHWSDDLWLFPYYTSKRFVPYDARRGGPAAAGWPGAGDDGDYGDDEEHAPASAYLGAFGPWLLAGGIVVAAVAIGWLLIAFRSAKVR